jgi:hypothetical protein
MRLAVAGGVHFWLCGVAGCWDPAHTHKVAASTGKEKTACSVTRHYGPPGCERPLKRKCEAYGANASADTSLGRVCVENERPTSHQCHHASPRQTGPRVGMPWSWSSSSTWRPPSLARCNVRPVAPQGAVCTYHGAQFKVGARRMVDVICDQEINSSR